MIKISHRRKLSYGITLWALLVLTLLVPAPSLGEPLVSVRDAIFRADGTVLALSHDRGIHVVEGKGVTFMCDDALPDSKLMLRSGEERILVAGGAGAHLSLTAGCKWQQTSGDFAFDSVIGLFRDPDDDDRVLIAYGEQGLVVESLDGGHTSTPQPVLSVASVVFTGFSASQHRILIAGYDLLDEKRLLWISNDAGRTFETIELGQGETLTPWALSASTAWLSHETTLWRFDLETKSLAKEQILPAKPLSITIDPAGTLWIALGADGLWNIQPLGGDVERAMEGAATWVHYAHDALWVGLAIGDWTQPALIKSGPSANDWTEIVFLSPELRAPDTCSSLNSQICSASTERWREDFGGAAADVDIGNESSLSGGGGCGVASGSIGVWGVFVLVLIGLLNSRRREKSEL